MIGTTRMGRTVTNYYRDIGDSVTVVAKCDAGEEVSVQIGYMIEGQTTKVVNSDSNLFSGVFLHLLAN